MRLRTYCNVCSSSRFIPPTLILTAHKCKHKFYFFFSKKNMKFLNFLFTCTGLSPNQSVYIFTAIKSNEDVSYVSLLIMVFESILKVITITWFCPENYKIYTCVRACVRVFVGGGWKMCLKLQCRDLCRRAPQVILVLINTDLIKFDVLAADNYICNKSVTTPVKYATN